MATTLLVGNAGLVGGAYLANRHDLSRNRIRLISLGGLLGGLAGLGVDLLVQSDDAAATHMTRDYDARSGLGGRDAWGASGRNALFGFDREGASLDFPVPMPTLLRAEDATGRDRWVSGLTMTLLRGAF